jgi:oxygen-independent coproporphyrinogen-3 oxidase
VPEQDLPFEFAMNALRLNEGFEPRLFTERTGLPFSRIEPGLRSLEVQGLMERITAPSAGSTPPAPHWRATPRGRQLLNDLVQRFLPGRISEAVAGS